VLSQPGEAKGQGASRLPGILGGRLLNAAGQGVSKRPRGSPREGGVQRPAP
jgi:hypothetical protein